MAPVELTLQGPRGRLGSITVSGIDGREYLAEVRRLTGTEPILSNDVTRLLATEGAEGAPADLVVYDEDPRRDPRVLDRPRLIVLRGRVVKA